MSLPVSRIILLNGASSAGKSTLCRALQAQLPEPFLYFALDLLLFSKEVVPKRPGVAAFEWSRQRPGLFGGYHRSLAAFASAGNNLIVAYVLETQETLSDLVRLLAPFDVLYVISDVGSAASRELVVGAVSGALREPGVRPGRPVGVAHDAWPFPPRS